MNYFDQTGDYDKAVEQLKLDVVTGTAPDIIAVSGIDYSMFSEKGVLADLYDFYQKKKSHNLINSVVSQLSARHNGTQKVHCSGNI